MMLVSVFKTGQNYMREEEESEFMEKCKNFVQNYRYYTFALDVIAATSWAGVGRHPVRLAVWPREYACWRLQLQDTGLDIMA